MDAVGPGTFTKAVMEPGFALSDGGGWVADQPVSAYQPNIETPASDALGCAPCGSSP